ncbi:MAG TPA: rhodanese-like domain-containing protein [Herpetosiphonaceae bacterium]
MNRRLPFKEATPREIKQRLDAGEDLMLIDVREPEEVRIASVAQAEVYPLSQAAGWIDSLPKDRALVILCHHGSRSAQVAMALMQRGHSSVTNVSGGIDAWSQQVDPSVPRY